MLVRSLPLFALVACGTAASTDSSGSGDTGTSLAPDEYADIWDTESAGCPDGATVYWAFEGNIDDNSKLVGEETWYWFFAGGGVGNCSDTFDISGKKATNPVADDPCNSCDRDFTADMVLNEDKQGCTQIDGYESLLDNDETDRIEEEAYELALMLDTNPLGGDPGEAQIWTYVMDDQGKGWIDRSIGRGMFTPDTEGDVAGPGALTWARTDGMCITITEG